MILNTAFHLEEDEFIALGNEKLQIINLNDFSIETYETSNEGFNSILKGNIDTLNLIQEVKINFRKGFHLLLFQTKMKFG